MSNMNIKIIILNYIKHFDRYSFIQHYIGFNFVLRYKLIFLLLLYICIYGVIGVYLAIFFSASCCQIIDYMNWLQYFTNFLILIILIQTQRFLIKCRARKCYVLDGFCLFTFITYCWLTSVAQMHVN